MASLAEQLTQIMTEAFTASGLPPESAATLAIVRVSDRPDLAQFQCNGAMAAAKIAKKSPRDIAQNIVEHLNDHPALSKIEIAGPGFINLNITDDFLTTHLERTLQSTQLGIDSAQKDQTIVLDYGGPNVAKPMHVAHLRSSIIGESLRRIYECAGYKTVGDIHMGDWGTPMGMIIAELGHRGIKAEQVTLKMLEEVYPAASNLCKSDPERMAEARVATQKLQDGETHHREMWAQFIKVSVEGMKKNFDALGVHFDLWQGESDAHDLIAPMVEDLKSRNIAIKSEGALVIPVEEESDKKEMPPLILLKSDGAAMYSTTDLATIIERMKNYNPAKIIYVVDQRQALHFEQVFRAAQKSGIAPEATALIHAGFGTMNGPDGKPFKTRTGGVMKLESLIALAIEKAQNRLDEAELARDMNEDERTEIALKVAMAALKFADLQNNRTADYMFDIDRMTSFEGKTGPYLLYQTVRINSLLRKAENKGFSPTTTLTLTDKDRALALILGEFSDHFNNALKNNAPHILCEYAYQLAQSFSSFYGNCHILSEDDEAIRGTRLALCDLTRRHLELILSLLGIDTPERM